MSVEVDTERYQRQIDRRQEALDACREHVEFLLDDLTEVCAEISKYPQLTLDIVHAVLNESICEARDVIEEIAEGIALRRYYSDDV